MNANNLDPRWADLADVIAARVIRALTEQSVKLPPPTDWLTPEEAAVYLRTTPKALQNHRFAGDGPPYHKVGRRVRYRRDELDAWLKGRRDDAAKT